MATFAFCFQSAAVRVSPMADCDAPTIEKTTETRCPSSRKRAGNDRYEPAYFSRKHLCSRCVTLLRGGRVMFVRTDRLGPGGLVLGVVLGSGGLGCTLTPRVAPAVAPTVAFGASDA